MYIKNFTVKTKRCSLDYENVSSYNIEWKGGFFV